MAENLVHEMIEPTMKSLDERLALLEERFKTGKQTVKDFTKENPILALGIRLLFVAGLGLLLGIAKNKD